MNGTRRIPWAELAVLVVIIISAFAVYRELHPPTASPGQESDSLFHASGPQDLIGHVILPGGRPIPAPAMVYIMSASPRNGPGTMLPSGWPDCAKHVKTDADGVFLLPHLAPGFSFHVMATAPGFKPASIDNAVPANGKRFSLVLKPLEVPDAPPGQTMSGRVVDSQGHPIPGALVEVDGLETADGGGRYGRYDGIDTEAVTDDQGAFIITDKQPFAMMLLKVSAHGFADKSFDQVTSGSPHDLALSKGAEVRGRVLLNGKPVPQIAVAVSGANRAMGEFLGHFEVATDDKGEFDFQNLPPHGDFNIYTSMESMKGRGAVSTRLIQTGPDGGRTEAGDLVVTRASRLAGQMVMADGQPVPGGISIYIGRESGWDGHEIKVKADGTFDFPDVPAETMSLYVRTPGYHLSPRNKSLDLMNPNSMVGRVDHDTTNLVFVLETGDAPRPDYRNMDPDYQDRRNRPLAGAEGGVDHSSEWTVAGHVFDNDTKRLVANFRVTPGQQNEWGQTGWKTLYAVDGTNGAYETYFSKTAAQPLLKVEAHGYLPVSTNLPGQDCPTLDIYLQKGSGPSGVVLTANGKPAADAKLLLMTDGPNQAGLSGTSLATYGDESALHTVDEHGFFSFEPRLGMDAVAASSADGFAIVSLTDFATNKTIHLQPFGQITGTLKRPKGPGTNEVLDFRLSDPIGGRINMQGNATTDGQGRFDLDNVPPGHLTLSYRQMMTAPNRGWMNQTLAEVELNPGQRLETNIVAGERVAADMGGNQAPPLTRVAGEEVKGVLLGPDGKPAANAEVALRMPNAYISIGRGTFDQNNLRDQGALVTTGPDGSFTLPMFEGAQSIVALNSDGYIQVSLDDLKKSPQVTLQKWGRIEGTLITNHHPGTNQTVSLSPDQMAYYRQGMLGQGKSASALLPPMFNNALFQAKTDDQGRFVFTFVPPGKVGIGRRVQINTRSTTTSELLTVEIGAGETLVTNVGGTGRMVIGKIKLSGDTTLDFKRTFSRLGPPTTKYLEKLNTLKTDAERIAYVQSAEGLKAMTRANFMAVVKPDGSFMVEDVVPGTYELTVQPMRSRMLAKNEIRNYASEELTVPPAKDDRDDSVVDLGEVSLLEHTNHIPGQVGK